MPVPVITVASGGLPVVQVVPGAPAPQAALPVFESPNGRGLAVTKVTAPKAGLAVTYTAAP